jgi:aspartate/glutamate racemase
MQGLPVDERAIAEALGHARALLRDGETEIPQPVVRAVRLLAGRGVWHDLSRNSEAGSCRDAANKRRRLGHDGIPLWDEMKSFFGRIVNSAGRPQYVVAHCRADRMLDFHRLAETVGAVSPPKRLDPDEITTLGMDYGLVNPFEEWATAYSMDGLLITSPVLQVFDTDLLRPVGVPGTVMTNAGDRTWAVELDASQLRNRLDNTMEAEIAYTDPAEDPRLVGAVERLPIGIITGNAPESGIALWNTINTEIRELLGPDCAGDVSMPPVSVASLPEMGMSMELDHRHEAVWDAMRQAIVQMCRDGVRLLSVACNTTQYFTPQIRRICEEYGTRYVSMPEVLGVWLRSRGVEQVALLGISFVSDVNGPWSAYREPLEGIEVETLRPEAFQRLNKLAYRVKSEGANEDGVNQLRDFLRQEVESEHVVLALTELSMLFGRQRRPGKSGRVLIDPLSLYGQALARYWLGMPFPDPIE